MIVSLLIDPLIARLYMYIKPKFIVALLLGKEVITLGDMNSNELKHGVMNLKYY
jgi:membrane glycosyltransferase